MPTATRQRQLELAALHAAIDRLSRYYHRYSRPRNRLDEIPPVLKVLHRRAAVLEAEVIALTTPDALTFIETA